MRVSLKRTGGIANLKVSAEVDSEQLSAAQAQKMKDLVGRADLFNQPAKPSVRPTPDQFQYEITVEDGGKTRSFVTNESAASGALRDLIDWVSEAASRQKGGNG
jgi:hypothetical protein